MAPWHASCSLAVIAGLDVELAVFNGVVARSDLARKQDAARLPAEDDLLDGEPAIPREQHAVVVMESEATS